MNFIRNHGRSLVALVGIVGFGFSAHASGPTVYALLNKEIRSVSQDANTGSISKVGFTEVDGLESRIGVKGNFKDESHDIDYMLELGLNTNKDDSAEPERIRMRHAYVKFKNSWGNITLGKFWLPDSLRFLKVDPLLTSGIQALGLDFKAVNNFLLVQERHPVV